MQGSAYQNRQSMKLRCTAHTKAGRRCSVAAGVDGLCAFHSPSLGRARAIGRKRGGERQRIGHAADSTPPPAQVQTLGDVVAVLNYTLREALPLENSVQRGRLLVQLAHAFIEAIKAGEYETRLAALEAAVGAGKA